MAKALSVNQLAWQKAQKLLDNPEFYGVEITKSTAGATIIDAGVKAPGGFEAGKMLTELCLGGAGKAEVGMQKLRRLRLPLSHNHL